MDSLNSGRCIGGVTCGEPQNIQHHSNRPTSANTLSQYNPPFCSEPVTLPRFVQRRVNPAIHQVQELTRESFLPVRNGLESAIILQWLTPTLPPLEPVLDSLTCLPYLFDIYNLPPNPPATAIPRVFNRLSSTQTFTIGSQSPQTPTSTI